MKAFVSTVLVSIYWDIYAVDLGKGVLQMRSQDSHKQLRWKAL